MNQGLTRRARIATPNVPWHGHFMRLALETIPRHLAPFIASQDPSLYTPMDHAGWRYIMRVSKAFFSKHAHPMYQAGLEETGLSIERIPLISEMDAKLRRFGWRAVPISGFIPPAVFLEFQALGVLPIACDMRKIEHLSYTPAPDIVHEAAGHAPIVGDPAYREYLTQYGEIAHKAIYSKKDMDEYEAVRSLSEVKENPESTPDQIKEAQRRLEASTAAHDYVSEATQLARMGWWTTEYGLIGDIERPLIYGAGLLSSIGESYHCFDAKVAKIPFSLDCINRSYDITRPQPQLYVAASFKELSDALEEFASGMAFRTGGIRGLSKAIAAETTTTCALETTLGVSGTLQFFLRDDKGDIAFMKWVGPVQLSENEKEIPSHGPHTHREGFSTPVGKLLAPAGKTAAELTDSDLSALGFSDGKTGRIRWVSGFELEGQLIGSIRRNGKNLLLSFDRCTIRRGERVFYRPDWGTFDLACGAEIVSVYGGAADRALYVEATGGYGQKPQQPKSNLTPENKRLNQLYAEVRECREQKRSSDLSKIADELDRDHPQEWLLRLELLELCRGASKDSKLDARLIKDLHKIRSTSLATQEMIDRGLALL